LSENLKERDHSENNINSDLKEIRWEDADWIHLTQDSDWWRDLVSTAMNLRFPKMAGNF
jgi:hypothetical protein